MYIRLKRFYACICRLIFICVYFLLCRSRSRWEKGAAEGKEGELDAGLGNVELFAGRGDGMATGAGRTAARVMDRTSNVRRLCRTGRNVGQSRLDSMKGRRKWANGRDEDEIRWVEEISEDSMGKTSMKCMGSGEGDRWLGRKKGKPQINRNEQHSESIITPSIFKSPRNLEFLQFKFRFSKF